MLEYTEFGGYYYGTPCQQVDFLINQGKNVLIEVEAQGVGQIKLKHPDALCVFVIPENMEELEKQIRLRYKDDETTIQQRLNKAQMPVTYADTTALGRDFGFKPNTSLREGLRNFAEWYKDFYMK